MSKQDEKIEKILDHAANEVQQFVVDNRSREKIIRSKFFKVHDFQHEQELCKSDVKIVDFEQLLSRCHLLSPSNFRIVKEDKDELVNFHKSFADIFASLRRMYSQFMDPRLMILKDQFLKEISANFFVSFYYAFQALALKPTPNDDNLEEPQSITEDNARNSMFL